MKKALILLIQCLLVFSLFGQNFTIAVIPDSQNYVNDVTQESLLYPFDSYAVFCQQMDYLAKNAYSNGGNINFAVHVGDFVSHWGQSEGEWERANAAMLKINNVLPFITVPGNHDYDKILSVGNGKNNRVDGIEKYSKYFGNKSTFFVDKEWYVDSFNEGTNSSAVYDMDGVPFLFIGLELEASDEAIEWAQNVINRYKNYPTIIVTHEFLSVFYELGNPGTYALSSGNLRKVEGNKHNKAVQVWEKLINPNKQIFMVLCGHSFIGDDGEAVRTDLDADGYKVYSILSDYQGRHALVNQNKGVVKKLNCGDGWLRLLNFNLTDLIIHVQTYSSAFECFEKDINSDYYIRMDWDWGERFSNGRK